MGVDGSWNVCRVCGHNCVCGMDALLKIELEEIEVIMSNKKYNNALTACEIALEVWAKYTGAEVEFIRRFCVDFYYLVSRANSLSCREILYFTVDNMFINSYSRRSTALEQFRSIDSNNSPMVFWIECDSDLKFSLNWK